MHCKLPNYFIINNRELGFGFEMCNNYCNVVFVVDLKAILTVELL